MARRTLLLATLTVAAFAPAPAHADCPAPTIDVSTTTVSAGDRILVTGDHWMAECNDTCSPCGGCGGSDPARGIEVRIAGILVGTADADVDDHHFQIRVDVPAELPPGPHALTATLPRDSHGVEVLLEVEIDGAREPDPNPTGVRT